MNNVLNKFSTGDAGVDLEIRVLFFLAEYITGATTVVVVGVDTHKMQLQLSKHYNSLFQLYAQTVNILM